MKNSRKKQTNIIFCIVHICDVLKLKNVTDIYKMGNINNVADNLYKTFNGNYETKKKEIKGKRVRSKPRNTALEIIKKNKLPGKCRIDWFVVNEYINLHGKCCEKVMKRFNLDKNVIGMRPSSLNETINCLAIWFPRTYKIIKKLYENKFAYVYVKEIYKKSSYTIATNTIKFDDLVKYNCAFVRYHLPDEHEKAFDIIYREELANYKYQQELDHNSNKVQIDAFQELQNFNINDYVTDIIGEYIDHHEEGAI